MSDPVLYEKFGNDPAAHTFIRAIIAACPKKLIHYLEIGVREGDSLDTALQDERVSLAVGVDNWGIAAGGTGRNSPDHVVAKQTKEQRKRTILLTGDSSIILKTICHKFDVIYVDGSHTEEGCLADLDNVFPLLDDEGVIIVDDLDHPSHLYLRKAVTNWACIHHCQINVSLVGYAMACIRK